MFIDRKIQCYKDILTLQFDLQIQCSCNKLLQTLKLETTQIGYLPVLEVRVQISSVGLKSRCQQGCILSGSSRDESLSLPFPASRGHLHPWPVARSPLAIASITPTSASTAQLLCLCLSLLLIKISLPLPLPTFSVKNKKTWDLWREEKSCIGLLGLP